MTDVDDSLSPSNGQVLKFSGGQWSQGTDEQGTGGGSSGTVADITGLYSVVGVISSSGSLQLANDSSSPGLSLYYGTNSGGARGFHPLPVIGGGGGITDHGAASGLLDDDHSSYVNVSGDSMSGNLSMGNRYITNLLNPVNPQDLATKAYVDAKFGASLSLLASGSMTNGATIPFPSGYTNINATVVTSGRVVGQAGSASSMDVFEISTVVGISGWDAVATFSKEDVGSVEPATLNYWVLPTGAAFPPPPSGLINITAWSVDSFAFGEAALYRLDQNGIAYDEGVAIPGQWKLSGPASDYDVYAKQLSGYPMTGTFNTWQSLISSRAWSLTPPPLWGQYTSSMLIAIRWASTQQILGSAVISFSAEGQSGGGGPIP
jgi:hypothetical protein